MHIFRRIGLLVFLLSILITGTFLSQEIHAQGSGGGGSKVTLEQELPGDVREANFADYIQAVFSFGLQLVVLAAAIFIVIGSYSYFAAGGNASMAEKGKEIITRSLIGLLLALVGWVILHTINTDLVVMKEPELKDSAQQ